MTAALARPLVHTVHLVTVAVLLGTGLLLLFPALRAQLTGGHSLVIRQAHRWAGIAFAALPALIVARVGARALSTAPAGDRARRRWPRLHLGLTVVTSSGFTLTGLAIWAAERLPEALADGSRVAHDALTAMLAVLVAAHLAELAVAARLRPRRATARAHVSAP